MMTTVATPKQVSLQLKGTDNRLVIHGAGNTDHIAGYLGIS